MKILKYDEALKKSENPDWFKNFYSREEICSDEQVDRINELASKFEVNPLLDYFKIKEDFLLQNIY